MNPRCRHRLGMTLVELLVVVAILGLLMVTVLPNVANTAESRRSREAARIVSSFIAKAQSRAFGRADFAGFVIEPTGSNSFTGIDLFMADVPAPYRGDTTNASVSVSTAEHPNDFLWRAAVPQPPNAISSGTAVGVEPYDLVRFGGRGPCYEIVSVSGTDFVIRMRGAGRWSVGLNPKPSLDYTDGNIEDVGQALQNTPWPGPSQQTFEIYRKPKPVGSVVTLGGGRSIDIRWSGYGPPFAMSGGAAVRDAYLQFDTAGQRTSILFDGTGRLRQIVEATPAGVSRTAVTGPVFLLVGRVDRVGQPYDDSPDDDSQGANWQYPDSYWVAIDPLTGSCKTAECKPNPTGISDLDKLIDSQEYIRQALLKGGL